MDLEFLGKEIVDAAYKVHTQLGPGLLESVYEVSLAYELAKRGLKVQSQVPMKIKYEEVIFDEVFDCQRSCDHRAKVSRKGSPCSQEATIDPSEASRQATWFFN